MKDELPFDVEGMLTVLNQLNLGVYVTDLERRIVLWNRKAEEITGYKAAEVVGRACHENILIHIDRDGHPLCTTRLCPLHRSITLNRPNDGVIHVLAQRSNGSRVAVSVHTAPWRDAEGNVIGGIETFWDETEEIHDLEFAQQVQQQLLPGAPPVTAQIQFDVRYYPHDLVGGDFYDISELASGKYGVMVADVSGHGVSAALYTMLLKSACEHNHHLADAPGDFLEAVNGELGSVIVDESFATALYGVVDGETGQMVYANAGHCTPLHYRAATGDVISLEAYGMPLGILDEGEYETHKVAMGPGDLLLCYTDGLSEVVDRDGEMLGDAGLAELLKLHVDADREDMLDRLYRQVKSHCGNVALADDVLLLSIRRRPL
jgi:phosphoserine phosphatase RsbU/P